MVRRDGAAQAGVRAVEGPKGGQAMRPSSPSSSSRSPGRRIVVILSSYHPSRPICSRRRIVFFRPPRGARDHFVRRLIQKSPSYACAGRAMRFLPRFTARSSPITITPTRRNAPRLERGVATATTTMTVARAGGATSWTAAGPCARRRRMARGERMMEGREALALIRRRGSVRR